MSDTQKGWMPLWLATYILLVGLITATVAVDAFCVMAYESGLEYTWQIGLTMMLVVSLPFVWYSSYLGYRYFANIPRMYYLLVGAPFIVYAYRMLSRETLYSDIFTFNGQIYAIHIGWEGIVPLVIMAVVRYELTTHWHEYTKLFARTGGMANAK